MSDRYEEPVLYKLDNKGDTVLEISEQARKCLEEIKKTPFTSVSSEWLDIIQRHLDAYHEAKSKELVRALVEHYNKVLQLKYAAMKGKL